VRLRVPAATLFDASGRAAPLHRPWAAVLAAPAEVHQKWAGPFSQTIKNHYSAFLNYFLLFWFLLNIFENPKKLFKQIQTLKEIQNLNKFEILIKFIISLYMIKNENFNRYEI
jgi:hypothetical protein